MGWNWRQHWDGIKDNTGDGIEDNIGHGIEDNIGNDMLWGQSSFSLLCPDQNKKVMFVMFKK